MRWAAGALVLTFAGGALAGFALWLAGFLWIAAIGVAAYGAYDHLHNRKYSLKLLSEVDDKETARRLAEEMGTVDSPDTVVCPYCLQAYPAEVPSCPYCGR